MDYLIIISACTAGFAAVPLTKALRFFEFVKVIVFTWMLITQAESSVETNEKTMLMD